MTEHQPATCSSSIWAKRIVIEVGGKQLAKLKKGKRALVMKDKQLYEIKANDIPKLFDANGVQLSKAQVRRLFKKM